MTDRSSLVDELNTAARLWVEQFGGGSRGEQRAIGVLQDQLLKYQQHPVMGRDWSNMIRAVQDGSYRRGERSTYSARVEEAFPDLYRQTDSPLAATQTQGPPQRGPSDSGRKRKPRLF